MEKPSRETYGVSLPCSPHTLRGGHIAERVEAEILYHKNEIRGKEDILRMRILQKIENCTEISPNG
jgi:hypothetical protein